MTGIADIENLQAAIAIGHISQMAVQGDIQRRIGRLVDAQRRGIDRIADVHDPQSVIGIHEVRMGSLHTQSLWFGRQIERALAYGCGGLGHIYDSQVLVLARDVGLTVAHPDDRADGLIGISAQPLRRGRILDINHLQAVLRRSQIGRGTRDHDACGRSRGHQVSHMRRLCRVGDVHNLQTFCAGSQVGQTVDNGYSFQVGHRFICPCQHRAGWIANIQYQHACTAQQIDKLPHRGHVVGLAWVGAQPGQVIGVGHADDLQAAGAVGDIDAARR